MLTLFVGRAKAGKTAYIMNEISRRIAGSETGMLLIVPEQYSHEAEKKLCSICGDSLSLYAETLSFTRLCSNVLAETGDAARTSLDKSGQILLMHSALESVAPKLKAFGAGSLRTQVLTSLLDTENELRNYAIDSSILGSVASSADKGFADKLHDLELIFKAYDALRHTHGDDAAQRLELLADNISGSSVGNDGHIFFDGFNDFTFLELRVIEELMKKNADITVSLTCDYTYLGLRKSETYPDEPKPYANETTQINDDSDSYVEAENGIFAVPARTYTQLVTMSKKYFKEPVKTILFPMKNANGNESTDPMLKFLERNLFREVLSKYSDNEGETFAKEKRREEAFSYVCRGIHIFAAKNRHIECEIAAQKILSLVQSGYRWRDIAVMTRNFAEYSSICESVFDKYRIPYFSSGRVDIFTKSPIAVIDIALDIAASGFEYRSIIRYLKTGISGLRTEECCQIENYVTKWQIRGSMWERGFTLPPSGYGGKTATDANDLCLLNELRDKVISPLQALRAGITGKPGVNDKLRALYSFLTDIRLAEQLSEKAKNLDECGEKRLADEFNQMWNIIVNTIDQMHIILGDREISADEFRRVFTLAMSQNTVGVIPISLDRVPLGDMHMSRRRDIKCLILLGATDDSMPLITNAAGVLSAGERAQIDQLPAGIEEQYAREQNILYSTLTLPSDLLMISYPTQGGSRPAVVAANISRIFDILPDVILDLPCRAHQSEVSKAYSDIDYSREAISQVAAMKLYGENITLSASRLDTYYNCPQRFFLHYGLGLRNDSPAEFDAMIAGNFTHAVLNGVLEEIMGDESDILDKKRINEIYDAKARDFVESSLHNFEGKNKRVTEIFNRYRKSALFVAYDVLSEIASSGFTPVKFELNLKELSDTQSGIIDRVDALIVKDSAYIMVVDYKTRKKAYTLSYSDVAIGKDLQMLTYLFSLARHAKEYFGENIVPAGVLYVPARDVFVSAKKNDTPEQIEKARKKEMKRNGIILSDERVKDALINNDVVAHIVKNESFDGELIDNSLISPSAMSVLSAHVDKMVETAKGNILNGVVACTPYYKSVSDNACLYCEYKSVCKFDQELGGRVKYAKRLNPVEAWEAIEEL